MPPPETRRHSVENLTFHCGEHFTDSTTFLMANTSLKSTAGTMALRGFRKMTALDFFRHSLLAGEFQKKDLCRVPPIFWITSKSGRRTVRLGINYWATITILTFQPLESGLHRI